MKKLKFLSFLGLTAFLLVSLASCDPENVFEPKPIDADTLDYTWDSTKVVKINLNSTTITTTDTKKVVINGSTATINAKGTYDISGTLTDGQIVVNAVGIVRLILNNAVIQSSTTSPLFIENATKAIIILPEGTESTISDAKSYVITEDSLNSSIYSKDYLAISGLGKLTVNGNYKGAISSRDELIIESGDITVYSVGFGIKGKDYLIINDGNFHLNCTGDGLKSDKDSTNDEGFIEINNGSFNIIAGADGISATQNVRINEGIINIASGGGYTVTPGIASTKGIKAKYINIKGGTFILSTSDNSIDANQNLTINGGSFSLKSGNKPLESDSSILINNGTINILNAVKGISSHKIYLNGGATNIYSVNDCLKATLGLDLTTDDGSYIEVNGGSLTLKTDKGDALDSNGAIKISGGTVVVQGSPTSPDDAVSYRSTFLVNGGNLIASGAKTLSPGNGTTQNAVTIRFTTLLIPGVVINIQDAAGNSILSYKISKYAYYLLVSLPALTTGTTYNVYTGGSVTGSELNGYFADGVYIPGTKKGSFTVNSALTSVVM